MNAVGPSFWRQSWHLGHERASTRITWNIQDSVFDMHQVNTKIVAQSVIREYVQVAKSLSEYCLAPNRNFLNGRESTSTGPISSLSNGWSFSGWSALSGSVALHKTMTTLASCGKSARFLFRLCSLYHFGGCCVWYLMEMKGGGQKESRAALYQVRTAEFACRKSVTLCQCRWSSIMR
jgi:hypothetical protein